MGFGSLITTTKATVTSQPHYNNKSYSNFIKTNRTQRILFFFPMKILKRSKNIVSLLFSLKSDKISLVVTAKTQHHFFFEEYLRKQVISEVFLLLQKGLWFFGCFSKIISSKLHSHKESEVAMSPNPIYFLTIIYCTCLLLVSGISQLYIITKIFFLLVMYCIASAQYSKQSPYYFLRSRCQKMKNITNTE